MPHYHLYAVIGHPIEHSLSPRIHALFAKATGEDIIYERILSPLEGFEGYVNAFAVRDGAHGLNITVPFKFKALALATQSTARAKLAGAANTLRFDAAKPSRQWFADNTDGAGLVHDITCNAGVALQGRRVLLIGAGGASSGVLGPLVEESPALIMVANRSVEKAHELVARHQALAQTYAVALEAGSLGSCGSGYHVVINASSSSLEGAGIPVAAHVLLPGALALDMMYGSAAGPFMTWAAEHSAHGRDGLGMLVEQAAESFFFWRGVRPQGSPVLAQLRSELAAL